MKKSIFLLVFAALVSSASSALEFKLGVGGIFNAGFGGGFRSEAAGLTNSLSFTELGGGAYVFVDAAIVELALSCTGGASNPEAKLLGLSIKPDPGTYCALGIAALGKLPLTVNPRLTIFPLLGVNYQRVLSFRNKDGDLYKNQQGENASADFSALWIQLGCGTDYNVTQTLFLRGEILYGIRLNSKFEKDLTDGVSNARAQLGHGPSIRIAIGCRF